MPLAFGQPVGGICQFAYAVEDIEQSAEHFTRELGVGPWFVRGPFQPPEGRYRGEPTQATFSAPNSAEYGFMQIGRAHV